MKRPNQRWQQQKIFTHRVDNLNQRETLDQTPFRDGEIFYFLWVARRRLNVCLNASAREQRKKTGNGKEKRKQNLKGSN